MGNMAKFASLGEGAVYAAKQLEAYAKTDSDRRKAAKIYEVAAKNFTYAARAKEATASNIDSLVDEADACWKKAKELRAKKKLGFFSRLLNSR